MVLSHCGSIGPQAKSRKRTRYRTRPARKINGNPNHIDSIKFKHMSMQVNNKLLEMLQIVMVRKDYRPIGMVI